MVDPASFALIAEPKPVDPFEERKPTLDEMIAMLKSTVRAEERAEDRTLESSGMAPDVAGRCLRAEARDCAVPGGAWEPQSASQGRRRRDALLAT